MKQIRRKKHGYAAVGYAAVSRATRFLKRFEKVDEKCFKS